jgi:hypothetical protein
MVGQDIATSTHECSHSASSEIRNGTTGKNNGFYCFKDRAVIFSEPKTVKSKAAEFIPQELRGSRFSTYITGQTAWEGEPLYIFDEWNAYINGMEVLKEKIYSEYQNMDFTCGPVEFMMYGMGLVLAIQKYDPEYFKREPNFLPFVQFQVDRSLQAESLQKDYPWDKTKFYLNKWPTCKDYLSILGQVNPISRDDFDMV